MSFENKYRVHEVAKDLGKSTKEITQILGIGLPLVKYRVKRARALLSAYLGKEEPHGTLGTRM